MAVTQIAEYQTNGGRVAVYKESAAAPGAIGAVGTANVDETITGVTTSDEVLYARVSGAPSSPGVSIQSAYCQASNVVRLVYANPTAGSITLSSHAVIFAVLKKS